MHGRTNERPQDEQRTNNRQPLDKQRTIAGRTTDNRRTNNGQPPDEQRTTAGQTMDNHRTNKGQPPDEKRTTTRRSSAYFNSKPTTVQLAQGFIPVILGFGLWTYLYYIYLSP